MAIIFAKTNKRQIYSVIILVILLVVLTTLIIILVRKKTGDISINNAETVEPPQVNFSCLKDSLLQKLELYTPTPELQDAAGRDNPFQAVSSATATQAKK